MSPTVTGAIATFVGAAVWGLIWLPIQHIDQLGVSGLWSIVLIQPAAAAVAFIFLCITGSLKELKQFDNWLVGISFGLSIMLYFAGILLSDVVRVIFLFYTLPIWTILWNAVLFRKKPIKRHYVVIAIAIVGLWMLLSGGHSWIPKPKNVGDWCGLIAGATWGLGLTLLENRSGTSTKATSFISFFWAFVFAGIALWFTRDASFNVTSTDALMLGLPLAILVGVGIQFPIMYLMVWGAKKLSAPTAALLTMSEILAASISASLILGNALNNIAWFGGLLIVTAAVMDIIFDIRVAKRHKSTMAGQVSS